MAIFFSLQALKLNQNDQIVRRFGRRLGGYAAESGVVAETPAEFHHYVVLF